MQWYLNDEKLPTRRPYRKWSDEIEKVTQVNWKVKYLASSEFKTDDDDDDDHNTRSKL